MVKGVLCLKTRLLFGSTLVLTYAICNLSTLFIAVGFSDFLIFAGIFGRALNTTP